MKKIISILVIVAAVGLSSTFVTTSIATAEVNNTSTIAKLEIPADVQKTLDKSCTMCHNTESKNTKGKMKLNFDNLTNGEYSTGKVIGKLNGISKVLGKSSMPPKKFLAKYPDKALTADESKLLVDWAKKQATALSGE